MKLRIRLKIDVYEIFRQEISDSIKRGWERAHRHTSTPRPDELQEALRTDLMNTLCDLLDFDDVEDLSNEAEFDANEDPP